MLKLSAFIPAAALLLWAGCQKVDEIEQENVPAVNVSSSALEPNANESGSVRAYVGTQVTATGFNLDKVGLVTIDGIEAVIVDKQIKTLVFEIPALPEETYIQQDAPHSVRLNIYDADCETVIFNYPYYVTVPVTDARVSDFSPKSGTVGDIITISGRNLDKITSVKFADVTVEYSSFTEASADAVKFAVPAAQVSAAATEMSLTAVWGEGQEIDVTAAEKFVMNIPVFEAFTPAATINLGEEFTLTGTNIGLCRNFKWGETDLIIVSMSEDGTSINLKLPTIIEGASGAEEAAAITAAYGSPVQTVNIAENVKVNTAPVGAPKPVFTSIAPTDAAYSNLYLGITATISGQNLSSVDKIIIDGVEVTGFVNKTDTAIDFVIPGEIQGTEAKTVSVSAEYDGGNPVDVADDVKVCPFYYTKGLRLGVGAGASTSEIGNSNAFVLLNEGRTISVTEWHESKIDEYVFADGGNSVTSSGSKVKGTKEQYYGVQPYLFITSNSAGDKIAFNNPANSTSQLKNFRYDGTALPSTVGTPVIFMAAISTESIVTAATSGTLDNILAYTGKAGSSTPALTTNWKTDSVIAVQYLTYEHASTAGGKPTGMNTVYQQGFIVIRDITCGDESTGKANDDRSGHVEFDLYWSNPLN